MLLAAGVVAVMVALSACGSSGSGTGSSGATPTKAAYVAEADKICAAAHKSLEPVQKALTSIGANANSSKIGQEASLVDKAADLVKPKLMQLKQLTRPSGDQAVLGKAWATEGEAFNYISGLGSAIKSLNLSKIKQLEKKLKAAEVKYNSLTKNFGFKQCGAS